MTTTSSSLPKNILFISSALFAMISMIGCGGPSREDVRTLGLLIDHFQAANEEGSRQLASGSAQIGYPFILASYEKQLEIVKSHRATYHYKGEIKGHLDAMEEGLTEGIKVYKKWIDAGYNSKNPAPDAVTTVSDFAIKHTAAETALTIAAGR